MKKYNLVIQYIHSIILNETICGGTTDKNGKEILKPIYDRILAKYDINQKFANYIIVQKNGKWGFINSKQEIVIPFEYEEIIDGSEAENKIFVVKNAEKSQLKFKKK